MTPGAHGRTGSRAVGAAAFALLIALLTGACAHDSPSSTTPTTRAPNSVNVPGPTSTTARTTSALDGVSGPVPVKTIDLGGTWGFTPITNTICMNANFGAGPMHCQNSPANGVKRTIRVPGGGWVKQGFTNVSVAIYSRTITIPSIAGPQDTKLYFGAINHKATLSVNGKVVGTNTTSDTASVFDLAGEVEPAKTYEIAVRVVGRRALVGVDGRYDVPEGASWSDDVAQGIFRSAELQVFPAVHIADTVVHTSVDQRTLSYEVIVANDSASRATVTLDGKLSSFNRQNWTYPTVPTQSLTVSPHATKTVTVGPLDWSASTASYWWPNVPYRPDYRAQLHELDLQLVSLGSPSQASAARVRFGFRQIDQVGDHYALNGIRVNFRGDSLQGANFDNIDHNGRGDAYDTLPGFLPPSSGNGGWPKAVDNYLRLNYNDIRIHQIPSSPYMLDVADERGLMIIDESSIRGSNNRENFADGRAAMISAVKDLVARDRNHASVLRWSAANEPDVGQFANPGAGPEFNDALYAAVMSGDTTRPVSIDGNSADLPHDNFTVFCHYGGGTGTAIGQYTESICAGPVGKPRGQGEFLWSADNTPQGFTWFATATLRMRAQGASDVRPYTLSSAWVSFIPGIKHTDMTLEFLYPKGPYSMFGEDNLPKPWSNPTIELIQRAFNPVAAVDTQFWDANKLSNPQGTWPTTPSAVSSGSNTRALTVFNDTFAGTDLDVTWKLHSGSTTGEVIDTGHLATRVPLGDHKSVPVSFDAHGRTDRLYLELTVSKPGSGVLFHDSSTVYQPTPSSR